MSAQTQYIDEDEEYIAREESLQYYLNDMLDDEYHKHFRDYLRLSHDEDFEVNEISVHHRVVDFQDYWRQVNTDYEDLYMTRDY